MAATFVDLGQAYPNDVFTAIIFGADRPKFGVPESSLKGRSVCVREEIFLFQGKPRMTLSDSKQLKRFPKRLNRRGIPLRVRI
jgi:hypothetical protein